MIYNLLNCGVIYTFVQKMDPHNTHVTENQLIGIDSFQELKDHTEFVNVLEMNDLMVLQSRDLKGSIINFNDPIDRDGSNIPDTSLIFTINHPNLKDLEMSGVYFWFTEKRLESGSFRGGNPKFIGLMAGIEFSAHSADLTFTYNHDVDYTGKEQQTIHFDRINPDRLAGVDELTIKIIHTKNNFKFEVFDGDSLISDSFKMNEPRLFNDKIKLHNIGVTSYYKIPSKHTAIELKNMNFSSREEGEEYRPMDLHIDHNDFSRSESQSELRQSIANLGHFISYLSIVFGTHGESTISEMLMSAKTLLKVQKSKLDQAILAVETEATVDDGTLKRENTQKMDLFDKKMHAIYNKIKIYSSQLEEFHHRQNASATKLGNMIVGFGLFIAGISLIGVIISKYGDTSKSIKNE